MKRRERVRILARLIPKGEVALSSKAWRFFSALSLTQVFTLLLFVTFLTFSRAFTAQYVTWDDPVLVLNNPLLKLPLFEAIPIFCTSFYHGDYMPLTLLSYWMEVAVFGFNPLPFHLTNLLLHLGCGVVLFKFLRSLRLREGVGLLICAVFLLHPLQVEPVMWISERKGLLSSFLLLLAMVASQKVEQARAKMRGIYLVLYYCLFMAALLAKATGVLVPAFLLWVDFSFKIRRATFWSKLGKHAVPALFAVLILGVRVSAYGGEVTQLSGAFFELHRWHELPWVVVSILGFYLCAFIFPFSQSIIYEGFKWNGALFFRILVMGVALGAIFLFWRRARSKPRPLGGLAAREVRQPSGLPRAGALGEGRAFPLVQQEIMFFAGFFLLFLLPVLQIIPRINFVNDRYMYLPSIGLIGLVAVALEWLSVKALRPAFCLAILLLAPLSFYRSGAWLDDFHLWSQTVKTSPWSGLAWNNHAMLLDQKGDVQAAVLEFEKALVLGKVDGTDNLAYNNLGVLYASRPGFLDQQRAISYFEKGIVEAHRSAEGYTLRLNLAGSYAAIGKSAQARQLLVELEKELILATRDKKYLELLEQTQGLLKTISTSLPSGSSLKSSPGLSPSPSQ